VRSFEPFTYTLTLKDHQAITEGEYIHDNGVLLQVIAIKGVANNGSLTEVEMEVREIEERK